jgi:two-component system, cell cycle sensor histidine kinase and response regulator CckA
MIFEGSGMPVKTLLTSGRGPLLTVVAIGLAELSGHTPFKALEAVPLYLATVAYAAFTGVRAGMVSAGIAIAYIAYFLPRPANAYTGSPIRMMVLALAAPGIAVVVGLLQRRMERMADESVRRERAYYASVMASLDQRKQTEEALRQSEDYLRQSQKMEAVGRLAGGVAHDFNNLMTVIMGRSELLMTGLDEADPLRRNADEIKRTAERAVALTRQLLAFSRKQVLTPKVLDLNVVVANMDRMLRRLIGEDIDLVTVLGPALERVKADPGQIEQVIMNLAINARDAMPSGGKLTIETANVYLDHAYARKHAAVRPGPYVMLSVSDNGTGMDADTQSHIFEPFFTTKDQGKGTGLGLATVYGIVKQSEGYIWVYSEPGWGTSFKMYLPRIADAPEPLEPVPAVAQPRGSETVLLVEDEDGVRELTREILTMNGYTVIAARHGAEALEVCQRHSGEIALILTDVVMPQMSGHELMERIRPLRPSLKVLYMSGYTDKAIVRHGMLTGDIAFLQKPFTPDALARKVREVLDTPGGAPA